MELYLIRHGETVDNVAGLYAGVRDSALTNFGVEQARRLGEHFAKEDVHVAFDHIFASPLSRAYKTAQAIRAPQLVLKAIAKAKASSDSEELTEDLEIVRVPELIEQDFGFYEGKNFQSRTDPKKSGKEAHREKHKDDPGFVDVESKESLNRRADTFLDQHLLPLFDLRSGPRSGAIAVVAHGILLSHLWRRLLLRMPSKSVTVAPDIIASKGTVVLQHLGGWSNTGYLQLSLTPDGSANLGKSKLASVSSTPTKANIEGPTEGKEVSSPAESEVPHQHTSTPQMLHGWSTLIVAIDRKDHLVGIKRQRGGIGRSAHDEGQQKLTGFFKRHRAS